MIHLESDYIQQAVYAEVLKQANAFEDDQTKERYLKAASRFRFPYWDPCLPRQLDGPIPKVERQPTSLPYEFGIPRMISNPEVYLRFPNSPGELVKVDNPLYQYKFPKELQDPDNSGGFWEENSDNVNRRDVVSLLKLTEPGIVHRSFAKWNETYCSRSE